MDGATHFMTVNTNGTSHATPMARVENRPQPEAKAKPSKAPRCTCGRCGTGRKAAPARDVGPLDREANLRLARELDELAAMVERAGDLDTARTIRERALVCHDLEEVEARNEARKAGTVTYVRAGGFVKGILTAPGVPSALDR